MGDTPSPALQKTLSNPEFLNLSDDEQVEVLKQMKAAGKFDAPAAAPAAAPPKKGFIQSFKDLKMSDVESGIKELGSPGQGMAKMSLPETVSSAAALAGAGTLGGLGKAAVRNPWGLVKGLAGTGIGATAGEWGADKLHLGPVGQVGGALLGGFLGGGVGAGMTLEDWAMALEHPTKLPSTFLKAFARKVPAVAEALEKREATEAAKAAAEEATSAATKKVKVGSEGEMFPGATTSKPGAARTPMTPPPATSESGKPIPVKAIGKGYPEPKAPKAAKPTPPPKVESGDVLKGPTGTQHKAVRAGQEQVARMGERRVVPTSESPVPKPEEGGDEELLRIETGEPAPGRRPTSTSSTPVEIRGITKQPAKGAAPRTPSRIIKPGAPAPQAEVEYKSYPREQLYEMAKKGDVKAGVELIRNPKGFKLPPNFKYLIEEASKYLP